MSIHERHRRLLRNTLAQKFWSVRLWTFWFFDPITLFLSEASYFNGCQIHTVYFLNVELTALMDSLFNAETVSLLKQQRRRASHAVHALIQSVIFMHTIVGLCHNILGSISLQAFWEAPPTVSLIVELLIDGADLQRGSTSAAWVCWENRLLLFVPDALKVLKARLADPCGW